jgi:hypothetical protein
VANRVNSSSARVRSKTGRDWGTLIGMFGRLREDWRRFKASKSGFRFRDRRHCHQRIGQRGFDLRRALNVAGGLVIVITSLLLAPLPGPAGAHTS